MKDLKDFRDSRTKGPITFYTLGFTLITAVGIVAMYNIEKENKTKALAKNITTTGKPALGGPWVLVDQDGIPRSDASYFGQFTLLYFGFTYCPDICPSELVKIGEIMKAIGNYDQQHFTSNFYYSLSSSIIPLEKSKDIRLKPLLISVDPSRDTVRQLKYYSQDFHPSIAYLTGTKDQVAVAAKAYRVYFSKVAYMYF